MLSKYSDNLKSIFNRRVDRARGLRGKEFLKCCAISRVAHGPLHPFCYTIHPSRIPNCQIHDKTYVCRAFTALTYLREYSRSDTHTQPLYTIMAFSTTAKNLMLLFIVYSTTNDRP